MKKSIYNPFVDGFQEVDIDKFVKMLQSQGDTEEQINEKLQIFTDDVNAKVNELIPTNAKEIQVEPLEVVDGELQEVQVQVVDVPVEEPVAPEEPVDGGN